MDTEKTVVDTAAVQQDIVDLDGFEKTFVTLSLSFEGSGMSVDLSLGYVATSNLSGTTTLYRLFQSGVGNYLYTTPTFER